VHLVLADDVTGLRCVDAQVTAHCTHAEDEDVDCVHLRELVSRRRRPHVPHADGARSPDTWHLLDEHL
jgi:hypothetical protein